MLQEALLLIFGPVVLFVIVALMGAWLYEQRTRQLRQSAEELGFRFADKDPALALQLFGPLKGLQIHNVLSGEAQGLEVALFDLHRALPSASQVAHVRFTVLVFLDSEANWPSFSLRPASFRARLVSRQQGKSLFARDAYFGRAYILEGEDEEVVGALFSEEVRRFFGGLPGLWIEAEGPRLFYTRARLMAARDLHSFLEEAFRIRKVLETGDVERPV